MTTSRELNSASNFEQAEQSSGFLLWKTQLIWRRKIEQLLKPLQLTHPQFVILVSLAYLTKDGTHVSQVELARHSSCDITMTSQILRLLEKQGLIIRVMLDGNEKNKYPALTTRGNELFTQAIKVVEAADTAFFGCLSSSEVSSLNTTFVKLTNFRSE